MSRDRLIQEVNDYLDRLAAAGDQAALDEVLGGFGDSVKVSELSTEDLQWIYDEYIGDQE